MKSECSVGCECYGIQETVDVFMATTSTGIRATLQIHWDSSKGLLRPVTQSHNQKSSCQPSSQSSHIGSCSQVKFKKNSNSY